MKIMIIAAALLCLLFIGASIPERTESPDMENGYITVGQSVVVLPDRLQAGDQVKIFDARGVSVFDKTVSDDMTSSLATLPEGVYSLVISRDGTVITRRNVPIAGKEGTR